MNNAQAWEKLFSKYDIVSHVNIDGQFRISAEQIKEFREPRLMTKFDHRNNLPELFAKNNLAILPVTRGDYLIAHFDAYHEIEDCKSQAARFSLPDNIQSLDYNNIFSEAIALNCAFVSGIIADFLNDDSIVPTVSGRMSTGAFDFYITDADTNSPRPVCVSNAQMEIDASYEGRSCMAVIEAKRELSEDFIIRQLYYPFRVWQSRITKTVRPIFLIYSNNIFSLYEYAFYDQDNYSSIKLIQHKNYSLEDTSITAQDIFDVLNMAVIIPEPYGIPFPQANTFERVINLCELMREHSMSKPEITAQYDFTSRQADYYANSARYLGLAEKTSHDGRTVYTLTAQGRKIMRMSYKNRQLSLCRLILSHKVFRETLILYFSTGHMPDIKDITDIIQHSELSRPISGDTLNRRSQTVQSWANWISRLITE